MRRLIWGFAGCTYHIVGNLMHWLICCPNFYVPSFAKVEGTILLDCLSVCSFIHPSVHPLCILVRAIWSVSILFAIYMYVTKVTKQMRVRSRPGPNYFSWRLIMKFLWSKFSPKKGCCRLQAKVCVQSKSRLPRKSVVRWTDLLDMTIAVDSGT